MVQRNAEKALLVLKETLDEYAANPVDLLSIGDGEAEISYLMNARQSYENTVLEVVSKVLPVGLDRPRILEIGAFCGIVSVTLAKLGCEVTALDIPEFTSNPRLQDKYRQAGVRMITANLKDYPLPLASDEYDLVIMCETLEHFNFNPLPALAEINRCLHANGQLYLALPNLASLPNRARLLCGRSIHNPIHDFVAQLSRQKNMIVGLHWREYTRRELIELLSVVNFTVEKHAFLNVPGSHFLARLLYAFVPQMRPAQVLTALKTGESALEFYFTEANKS